MARDRVFDGTRFPYPPAGPGFDDDAGLWSGAAAGNLLFVLVEYADSAATHRSESDWANLLAPRFVTQQYPWTEGRSVDHYFAQASFEAVDIAPARETFGSANNGVIGWLTLPGNHPDPGALHTVDPAGEAALHARIAEQAIWAADPYIDYAAYDVNVDGFVSPTELSVVIVVAGHATLGVFVHELGHLTFGLPDLDDIDGSSPGIGAFDVMGQARGASTTPTPTWARPPCCRRRSRCTSSAGQRRAPAVIWIQPAPTRSPQGRRASGSRTRRSTRPVRWPACQASNSWPSYARRRVTIGGSTDCSEPVTFRPRS